MESHINKGIILIILVTLLQAIMLTIAKAASDIITTGMQVFSYCFIPLLFYIPQIAKNGLSYYKTGYYFFFFIRGVFSASAVFCFFYSVQYIHLGLAAVFYNSSPIYIPLLARIFLREKTSYLIYLSILIAMIGVIVIIHPGYDNFESLVTFVALLSGVLMASQQTMLRNLTKKQLNTDKILFYQCLMSTLASVLIILAEKSFGQGIDLSIHFNRHQASITILVLLVLGSLSYLAQYLVTKAFSYMAAAKLAPFLLVSVPISSFFGWIFWEQKFTLPMFLGAVLVLVGMLVIAFEKNIVKNSK